MWTVMVMEMSMHSTVNSAASPEKINVTVDGAVVAMLID